MIKKRELKVKIKKFFRFQFGVAPFYDLLSSSVYKENGQNFAFKNGGQNLCLNSKGVSLINYHRV